MDAISEVLRELHEAVAEREHVHCDLSEVAAIDMIGFQLLLAAARSSSSLTPPWLPHGLSCAPPKRELSKPNKGKLIDLDENLGARDESAA